MGRTTKQQNKRELAASDSRQAEVTRLYLTGSKIDDIAEAVGVSYRTVMRDLERARAKWKEETARQYDDLLPEKLKQLEEIRTAAWEGWAESRKDFEETTDGPNGSTTKRRGQAGNPAFLGQLEKILRLECQLRGMLDDEREDKTVPQVLEVVIKSREEHEEFKSELTTLNLEDFKDQVQR